MELSSSMIKKFLIFKEIEVSRYKIKKFLIFLEIELSSPKLKKTYFLGGNLPTPKNKQKSLL